MIETAGTKPAPLAPIEVSEPSEESTGTKKVLFSRTMTIPPFVVKVCLPDILPDCKPFVFPMRIKLTVDAEDERQKYIALSPTEQVMKEEEYTLDEVCSLIAGTPQGFEDLKDDGNGPGSSFKNYVKTAVGDHRDILMKIVQGASSLYWRKTMPQEFRG